MIAEIQIPILLIPIYGATLYLFWRAFREFRQADQIADRAIEETDEWLRCYREGRLDDFYRRHPREGKSK